MKSRKDNGALCVCAQSLSHVWLCVTLWTVAHLASLSMEFSRQEYWSRFPFSLQGIFPTQGSNPRLLHWQEQGWGVGFRMEGTPVYIWLIHNDVWKNHHDTIKYYPPININWSNYLPINIIFFFKRREQGWNMDELQRADCT